MSDEMLALGPLQRDVRRLLLPPGADLREHDVVVWHDDDESEWIVSDVPVTQYQRGMAHHLEAIVERKAVT